MSPSRRDFMKDAAVVGAAAAAGGSVAEAEASPQAEATAAEDARCPYFDQPMYCKGMSKTGRPLCEE